MTITATNTTVTLSDQPAIASIVIAGRTLNFNDYVSSLDDVGAGLTLNNISASDAIMTRGEFDNPRIHLYNMPDGEYSVSLASNSTKNLFLRKKLTFVDGFAKSELEESTTNTNIWIDKT